MKWFFQKNHPPVVSDYLAAAKHRAKRTTEVNGHRLVVLDTETSGLDVDTDRILSIALFEMNGGQMDMARSRKWIVYQPEARPTEATTIHGILPCETREGTPEKEVLTELLPLLAGAIVVGHHIDFDSAMLNKALMRHFHIRFRNRIVDTAHIAMDELIPFHKTGYANQPPPALEEVAAQFDLPPVARHTAEGDAFITAEIFLFLCGRIRRRKRRPAQLRDLPITRFRP
jgi:DNA polymerase-3 subunit epsilon